MITSIVVTATVQVDGTTSVIERHTRNSTTVNRVWTAPSGWTTSDVATACQLYGERLDVELTRKEAIVTSIYGAELPIPFGEFMRRFTSAERKKIRNREKTNDDVADFLDLARTANYIFISSPKVAAAIGLLEALGDIAVGRSAEVLQ